MTSGIHDTGEVTRTPGTETAVLAGGCFWGVDELIRKKAEGISSYESNKNLVLTGGWRADSVPNLEI